MGWDPGCIKLLAWLGASSESIAVEAGIWRSNVLSRIVGGLLVSRRFLLVYIANVLLWQLDEPAMVLRGLWGSHSSELPTASDPGPTDLTNQALISRAYQCDMKGVDDDPNGWKLAAHLTLLPVKAAVQYASNM